MATGLYVNFDVTACLEQIKQAIQELSVTMQKNTIILGEIVASAGLLEFKYKYSGKSRRAALREIRDIKWNNYIAKCQKERECHER